MSSNYIYVYLERMCQIPNTEYRGKGPFGPILFIKERSSGKGEELNQLCLKYTGFMFKYTNPSLQGDLNQNMGSGELHFGDKSSKAKLGKHLN